MVMRDKIKTIGNLIDKQNTAFLGSISEEGFPNMKAMLPPRMRENITVFYFTTNMSSVRVAQFKKNPKACLYFCDRRFFRGVQLIGTVEVLEDQESKDKIWLDGDTMYYPLGPTDPDYCVLCFTAIKGRYYSHLNSEDFEIE